MEKKENLLSSIQIVCFKIGNEEYGCNILQVQEILKLPKVTKLPRSKPYIMGVIDLRGKVLPIVDLSRRFGIETMGSARQPAGGEELQASFRGRSAPLRYDVATVPPYAYRPNPARRVRDQCTG